MMSVALSPSHRVSEYSPLLLTKSSRKRERQRDFEEFSSDIIAEHSKARSKRSRQNALDSITINDPRYLIVHHVTCDLQRSHHLHERQAYYLDVPKLFMGDCKASMLRGKRRIPSIDEYLDNNTDISIVTYKTYSCNQYFDAIGEQFERLPMPSHPHDIAKLAPFFFLLRKDGDEARHHSQRMAVMSSTLKEAIHLVTGMNSERIANLHLNQRSDALYHLLYHCRRLKDQTDRELGDDHRLHLEVMIKFMNEAFGRDYDEADELFSRGFVTEKHLPKLFCPNEVVVSAQDGQLRAYVIDSIPDRLPVTLDCWSWEFDGMFRKETTKLQVDWPSSAQTLQISELSAYPLRFDQSELSDKLKRRGEMFWKCRKERLVAYNPPIASFQMQTSNPRYMVDMNTYREINDVSGLPPQRDDLGQDVMDQEEPPEGPFSLLLPATILGFGFHDRKWRSLAIEHVSDVNWNIKAFEHLVINSQKKDLIEALVNTQSDANNTTDFMEGKGNGLIILLHGGPGTGKTLTAESVAELTKKPLYRIACGDIGTNAEDVEKYLVSVFYIGTIWKCVVLLDEADVFLEERQTDQLQRNALVSVFLRALEYYDGILILTSNRVGTFDEAFKSRVQISLHYPRLNKRSRAKVWLNFIDSLGTKDAKVEQLRKRVDLLAKKNLNGREIRNTVKSAMQLAHFKRERLSYNHLEKVIDVSTEFTTYLKEVHGHSEAEWAESKGIRGKE